MSTESVDFESILSKIVPPSAAQITKDMMEYVKTLVTCLQGLETKLGAALGRIDSLEGQIETLTEEQSEMKTKMETLRMTNTEYPSDESPGGGGTNQSGSAGLWSQLKNSAVVRSDITNIITKATAISKRKEKNLIMFGVKKGEDQTTVEAILTVMDVNLEKDKYKVTRFKAKDGDKPAPVLLEFTEVEDKMTVLRAARKLRGTAHDRVFINLDLTESEMVRDKDLRRRRNEANQKLEHGADNMKYGMFKFSGDEEESKFFWGIRNADLRRIKKK